MNIRISKGTTRFRINSNELAQLMAGQELELLHPLQAYNIKTATINENLSLQITSEKVLLIVDKIELEDLAKALPAREGIEEEIDGLLVSFEVDIKK